MSTERKQLSVNELDFFTIRSNLKDFLSGQSEFKDYDFEGSGLSVLLDALAYTTHYQGIYNNLTANELFLDSALKRSSLVSHAKSLGYVPRSKTAPVANISVYYDNPPSIIRAGTAFTTSINNKTYNFTNTETVALPEGSNTFDNVIVYEGTLKTDTFIVPNSEPYQRFRIDDDSMDTKTIKVSVYNSTSDLSGVNDVWTVGTNAVSITGDTKAYFVEEDFDGAYSVVFGDDVIGTKLEAGNVVNISYLQTNGVEANNAGANDSETNRTFSASNAVVTVNSQAGGGSNRERIASIRYNAPKAFASQNRAVTVGDFEALINNNFSGFSKVFVFGGENAVPPQFGKVFIVLKPNVATIVPTSLKNSIEAFLRDRTTVSVIPEVLDPIPLYFRIALNAVYNPNLVKVSDAALISSFRQPIFDYVEQQTQDFNTSVSYAKIQKQILDATPGVESISLSPALEYRFVPTENVAADYQFDFKNPIFHPHDGHSPGVVYSNDFDYADADGTTKTVRVEDDGFGKLRIYETLNGVKNYIDVDFGSVNYGLGVVSFNEFAISAVNNGDVRIYAAVGSNRIFSSQQSIIEQDIFDNTAITVSVSSDDRPDNRANLVGEEFIGTTSVNSTNTSPTVRTTRGASGVAVSTATATTSLSSTTGSTDSGSQGGGGTPSTGGGGTPNTGGGGTPSYGGGY